MDAEDRATIRNKLAGIDGIYKKADRLLKALIFDLSKAKAISRRRTINELEVIRKLLADIPPLKIPIREIVNKEEPKKG